MNSTPCTVIIPAFNEEVALPAVLVELTQILGKDCELLVVDGGNDQTEAILDQGKQAWPGLCYFRNRGDRGKGHAIREGICRARYDIQVQFDADGQFLARDIPRLVGALEKGKYDLVMGSRFHPEAKDNPSASFSRGLGNRVVSAWASLLFSQRWTDVLAGIKCWRRESMLALDLQSDGFEYEVELPSISIRKGFRVGEIPVQTVDRKSGESKVSVFRVGLRVLWATWKFRWRRLSQ